MVKKLDGEPCRTGRGLLLSEVISMQLVILLRGKRRPVEFEHARTRDPGRVTGSLRPQNNVLEAAIMVAGDK